MLLTVLMSAALLTQASPEALPQPPATPETQAAPEAAVTQPTDAQPAAVQPAATSGAAQPDIETGLAAFRARRLAAAKSAFERAVAADPQSAAAAYYLGYTLYKLGEPSRRMNANKERARTLFATAFSLDPQFRPDFARR